MEHPQIESYPNKDAMNPDVAVTYRTVNLFSREKRFINFISDVAHLLKTARNCLSYLGSGKFTRYMRNRRLFLHCKILHAYGYNL